MQYRLKTTKATAERLKELQSKTNLTPNILARIAVSLSLREKEKVELINIPLLGLDFNRSTLTGKYDFCIKLLSLSLKIEKLRMTNSSLIYSMPIWKEGLRFWKESIYRLQMLTN